MTLGEFVAALEQLVGPLPAWYVLFLGVFGTAASAAFGSWFGAYLKLHAKHFFTREQASEILEKLRETTREVAKIKANISSEMWTRQQRWELRRRVYISLLNQLRAHIFAADRLQSALTRLSTNQTGDQSKDVRPEDAKHIEKQFSLMMSSVASVEAKIAVSAVVLTKDSRSRLGNLIAQWNEAFAYAAARSRGEMNAADLEKTITAVLKASGDAFSHLIADARRDLGTDSEDNRGNETMTQG